MCLVSCWSMQDFLVSQNSFFKSRCPFVRTFFQQQSSHKIIFASNIFLACCLPIKVLRLLLSTAISDMLSVAPADSKLSSEWQLQYSPMLVDKCQLCCWCTVILSYCVCTVGVNMLWCWPFGLLNTPSLGYFSGRGWIPWAFFLWRLVMRQIGT